MNMSLTKHDNPERDAEREARGNLRIAAEAWYRAKHYGRCEDREKAGAALETFAVEYAGWKTTAKNTSRPAAAFAADRG